MTRVTVPDVTINDTDIGALPVAITDSVGNLRTHLPVDLYASGGNAVDADNTGRLWTTHKTVASLPHPSAAETISGSTVNLDVSTFEELGIYVNVTAASGTTPTISFYVDGLDASGNWQPLMQLNAGGAWTGVTQALAHLGRGISLAGATVGTHVYANLTFPSTIRIRWTITGTSPSFTFSVALSGK